MVHVRVFYWPKTSNVSRIRGYFHLFSLDRNISAVYTSEIILGDNKLMRRHIVVEGRNKRALIPIMIARFNFVARKLYFISCEQSQILFYFYNVCFLDVASFSKRNSKLKLQIAFDAIFITQYDVLINVITNT